MLSLKNIFYFKLALIVVLLFSYLLNHLKISEASLGAKDSEAEKPKEIPQEETPKSPTEELQELLAIPPLDSKNISKEELGRYIDIAERKKEKMELKSEAIRTDLERLAKLQQEIKEQIEKLKEERQLFTQTIQKEKEIDEQRLNALVELYKKMDVKKAAPIIAALNLDLIVQIMNHKDMPKKQIQSILATMDPSQSVKISEYYARNKSGSEFKLLAEINASLAKEFAPCPTLK